MLLLHIQSIEYLRHYQEHSVFLQVPLITDLQEPHSAAAHLSIDKIHALTQPGDPLLHSGLIAMLLSKPK